MPNAWFRMYTDFLEDPKMLSLDFEHQRHFIGVLALKSAGTLDQSCNQQLLDMLVAQRLWIDRQDVSQVKENLISVGLIDEKWQPVAWEKRQVRSDNSGARVQRYREKRKAQGLPSQWQPKKGQRQRIYERDGHACVYCGNEQDLTLDHYVPLQKGGDHSDDNLVTACRVCNAKKRDFSADEAGLSFKNPSALEHVTLHARYCNGLEEKRTEEIREEEKGKRPKTAARFRPPTLEQVAEYCRERGNKVNAKKFMAHYQSNGWMRGKTKIKDWKATVRYWETNENENGTRTGSNRRNGSHATLERIAAEDDPEELGSAPVSEIHGGVRPVVDGEYRKH